MEGPIQTRRTAIRGLAVATAGTAALGACTGRTPAPEQPASAPIPVADLLGKSLRVHRVGDRLTLEMNPDRVTVQVDSDNHIVEVWIA